jgi:UDP-N-acetylglucosamine diphosphorylase/glucosamine-1-phosphate N-acetyltransferase
MNPILFDDGGGDLRPLCDLRASFELRSGAMTTAQRLAEQMGVPPVALRVAAPLAELVASRHDLPVNRLPDGEAFTLINGRCTRITFDLPTGINTALADEDGSIIAARVDLAAAAAFVQTGELPRHVNRQPFHATPLIRRPWHLLQQAAANLEFDLQALAKRLSPLEIEPAPRVTVVGKHRVLIGKDTVVHPHVVFDTTDGPICIDDRAVVRSMSVMVGPGYVGHDSIVVNHAHIRGHNIIGPWCKVGGEVNSCVFQGYANKAHSGYLGNTFVGEWVNLGADTVTSNLKNTYSEIRMQVDPLGAAEPTGMTHLGSILGDHVKTAIGTKLNTGSVIHTGAMLATTGFPPKCTRPFAFITVDGAEKYRLDKFCEVAEAVMKRRGQVVGPALHRRIAVLHAG